MLEHIVSSESKDSIVFIPRIARNDFTSSYGYSVLFYREDALSMPKDQYDPRLMVLTDILQKVSAELQSYRESMSLFSAHPNIVQVLKDNVKRASYSSINIYVLNEIVDDPKDKAEEIDRFFKRRSGPSALMIVPDAIDLINIPLGDYRNDEPISEEGLKTSRLRRKISDFIVKKSVDYWIDIPPREDTIHEGIYGCYYSIIGVLSSLIVAPLIAIGAGELISHSSGWPLLAECAGDLGLAAGGAIAVYKFSPQIITKAVFGFYRQREMKREEKIAKLIDIDIPEQIRTDEISQLSAVYSFSKAIARSVYLGHLDTSIDLGAAFVKEVIVPAFRGMGLPVIPETDILDEIAYEEKTANPKAPDIRNSKGSIGELDRLWSRIDRTSLKYDYKASLMTRIDEEINSLNDRLERIRYSDIAMPWFGGY